MKRLALITFILAMLAAPADAALFRRSTTGFFPYWSPGAFRGLWSQNRGPRMVYRGDYVPTNVKSY